MSTNEQDELDIEAILALLPLKPATPQSFLGDAREILIYGAGKCGKDVADLLRQEGLCVGGFLDCKLASGGSVAGLPVLHPADQGIAAVRRAECCVIIAIFNPHVAIPEIQALLMEYGYRRVLSFVDFHRYYPTQLGERFWLSSQETYQQNISDICKAYSLLADETSKEIYRALLAFRISADYTHCPKPSQETQYFDNTIPRWQEPMSFIDCGSYTGDTLETLRTTYKNIEKIAAFEPDSANFIRLVQNQKNRGGETWPSSRPAGCGQRPLCSPLMRIKHQVQSQKTAPASFNA